jgi:hypothetical protein
LNEEPNELDGWIAEEDTEVQLELFKELSETEVATLSQPEVQQAVLDFEGCIEINGKD